MAVAWKKIAFDADLTTHINLTTGIHGVGAGAIVGTTLSQTLTNKTLTSPTINGTIATTGLTLPAVTLNGTVTLNGQFLDAGAGSAHLTTTGSISFVITTTSDGDQGPRIYGQHISASPAIDDIPLEIVAEGKDADSPQNTVVYGRMRIRVESPAAGAAYGKFEILLLQNQSKNLALTLASSGVLAVDLAGSGDPAQVNLFDSYDDALVLRQGIQLNNRELLADMGVLTRKDTGSGYMMNLQPMVRLLAGGIYQTSAMLEDTRKELRERLADVEARLTRAGLK